MKRVVYWCALTLVAALAAAAHATGPATAGRSAYAMRDLGTFGGAGAGAGGINDKGQVVIVRGDFEQPRTVRSLLWENGRVRWLGTLAGGATAASAINGRGQVAGGSLVGSVPHAFLWQNGKMRDIGVTGGNPGSVLSTLALNDRGQVAGTRIAAGSAPRAFLWQDGEMLDLGTLGGATSAAYGINERGEVVGLSNTTGEGVAHAFLWQKGTMRDIATPTNGVQLTWALAINDKGQVAALGGRLVDGKVDENTLRAYLWSKGTITDLGKFIPGAVNSKGQIVGSTSVKNGRGRAVLWENGRVFDLGGNPTGTTAARAINERGQIVGTANINGHWHAVLWTLKR